MTTNQVEPDVDAWREQEGRQRGSARNKKLGAVAVAAAIGIAAVAVILGMREGQNATTPADESPAVRPTEAQEVAADFLRAYGAFDAERAIT